MDLPPAGHSGGPFRQVLHVLTLLQLPVREQMLLLLSKVKTLQLEFMLHISWHSHSSLAISVPTVLPLQRPTSKQSSQPEKAPSCLFLDLVTYCQIVPDGEAVVVVVVDGQTLGPLEQVEQVLKLVQLPITLQIPFDESKVKSVHPGVATQVS